MALTSSGAIKMSDIKAALDPTSNSLRVYAAAAKATTGLVKFDAPDAFSDFYSYAAPPPPTPPPTPAPPTYNAFLGAYSAASAYTACNTLGPLVELYSLCSTLVVNCKLYTTNTAPFMVAQTGYYSIGTNWYYVGAAGNIDSTGTCASTLPPTPAPTQTTFTGFVAFDEGGACAGGDYGTVTIIVFGTTLCNATSVRSLSSATIGNVFSDMQPSETFWISRLGKVRQFTRNGRTSTASPDLACADCPTPPPPTPAPPTPPPPTPAPPTPPPPTPPPPTPPPPTPPPPTPAPLPIYNSVYLSSGTNPCDASNNSGGIQS